MASETLNVNETINGTVNENSSSKFELVQPFKVENDSNSTLEVKPLSQTSSETLEIKPLSQNSSETLEIKPLSQTSSETVELKPVRVDNRQEVAYTDPIRTDSTLDLKPVAFDMCVRTGQASLPPTHVCEPYRHKIAFTLMGVEMYGLVVSGESQTIVDDRPSRRVIPGEILGRPSEHHDRDHDAIWHHHDEARRHRHDEGGMRIRLR
jgi:hypothetical protein